MTNPAAPGETDINRLVTSGALSSARSPIYRWLWRNYAALAPKLDESRVHWPTFAAFLAESGVKDVNGHLPQAGAVRRSWWRVRKAKQAARERMQAKQPPARSESAPASSKAAPVMLPPADERAAASLEPPSSETDPLAAIRAEMNARSGRKPNAS